MKFDNKFESAYNCEILKFKISRNYACGILYQKSCNGEESVWIEKTQAVEIS